MHYVQRSKLHLKQTKDPIVTLLAVCGTWVKRSELFMLCTACWAAVQVTSACCSLYGERKDSVGKKKKETTICSNLRILRNSLRFTIWTIEINVLNWKLNFLDAFLAFLSWCVFKIGKYREVECGLCLLKVWMMEDWRIIAKVYSIFWGNTNVLKLIVVMVAQFCGDIKNY